MDQIEEVLSKIDIVELINSYVPLKKAGRNFKACCPFHSEKTPSFIVSPELQIFKCFGCGVGGSAIKFLQEYEKMDFGEALRFLAEKAGVKLREYKPDKRQLLKERLLAINHLAAEFYHYILTRHSAGKKGLLYLKSRGINNQSLKIFKLGFAPPGWENLINFLVRKKGYAPMEVEQVGLVIKSQKQQNKSGNYYDRFRQRIIFPIYDHRGNIVGFSGRVLNGEAEKKKEFEKAKYINTPETLLYHKSRSLYGLFQAIKAIKSNDSVILVEGEFDVISSFQAGVKNVVAIKGSALTKEQAELLSRFSKNFTFCLDADLAGELAAKRGIEIAESFDVNIKVINLFGAKDADEAVRSNPQAFYAAVKEPIFIYDFYLKSALKRFGLETAEAKKKISNELLPLFNKISNEVIKAHYFQKLADQLEIPLEAVVKEAQRQRKLKDVFSLPKNFKEKNVKSRQEILEEYLLILLFQTKENLKNLLDDKRLDLLTSPAIKRIIKFLQKYLSFSKEFKIKDFIHSLPEELKEVASRLYLKEIVVENDDKIIKEYQKVLSEIEKLLLRDKLRELRKILDDKSKKKKEREKAEREIVKISQKIFQDEKEKN